MSFDDFFKNKNKYQENYSEHTYSDANRYSYGSKHSDHVYNKQLIWLKIKQNIMNNKKQKYIVLLSGIFVLVIAVLIVVLLPFIVKLFNYFTQNGLQGILDLLTVFLDKIWKGSVK